MIIIKHRVNTIDYLKKLVKNLSRNRFRSNNKEFIQSRSLQKGAKLSNCLKYFYKLIVLNVKKEGLEKFI